MKIGAVLSDFFLRYNYTTKRLTGPHVEEKKLIDIMKFMRLIFIILSE